MSHANADDQPSSQPGLVEGIAHVGLTVPDLDAALRMWQDGLGFTLERRLDLDEDVVRSTTGVLGARVSGAVVRLGHQRVELLQYEPPTAGGATDPGAHGAMHVALVVTDLHRVLAVCGTHGWKPVGPPHELTEGSRAGTRVVYLHGPAGGLIELMAPREPAHGLTA